METTEQELHPDAEWRASLAEGRFMLQRARQSGTVFFPPRIVEPGTGNADLEWIEATGMGTVYSVTIIIPKPPKAPYNVALVDLDEGPRMMSRIDGIEPDQIGIGMRVVARIDTTGETPVIIFDAA